MNERHAKTALVAAVAAFMALVVWNNLADYGSNLAFVRHVLLMDTTFPDNRLRWRALGAEWMHHAFYAAIIVWEAAAAALAGTAGPAAPRPGPRTRAPAACRSCRPARPGGWRACGR